jgi:hypothetical protein
MLPPKAVAPSDAKSDVVRSNDKIEIIREHASSLRNEAARNAESQRTIFKLVIAGIAGIAVLRKDVELADLQAFLPLAPILVMIVIAVWLGETAFSFRCGRWLAIAEERINELAGAKLLDYETELLRWRIRVFKQHIAIYGLLSAVTSVGYYALLLDLLKDSALTNQKGFSELLLVLAVLANAVAIVHLFRIRYELRRGFTVQFGHDDHETAAAMTESGDP